MKTLVVYYSLEGSCKLIAETVADAAGAEILRISPVKDIPSKGFFKFFIGGMLAGIKHAPKLKPFAANPPDYDLVVIGTPVWNNTLVPAIRSFASKFDWSGKRVALFACCGGSGDKALAELKKILHGANVAGEIQFLSPLKHSEKESTARAREWIAGILKRS